LKEGNELVSVVTLHIYFLILVGAVRFPGLPDFLRSSGSGTGSTQPREDNYLNGKVAVPVLKTDINGRRDPLR
jgi:hypothetical protein